MFDPSADTLTTELLKNNKPLPVPKVNVRQETWFMQDENDRIVAMNEIDAYNALQPLALRGGYKPQWKIIGVSFAEAYAKACAEITLIKDPDPEKQNTLRRERLLLAFDEAVAEARGTIKRPRNVNIRDISGNIQDDPRIKGELGNR